MWFEQGFTMFVSRRLWWWTLVKRGADAGSNTLATYYVVAHMLLCSKPKCMTLRPACSDAAAA